MKRITAWILAIVTILSTTAFAADYWTEANEDIQTGIGQEDQVEVDTVTIDYLIKRGWSDEFAAAEESTAAYVTPYLNEIKLVLSLGLMSNDELGDFKPLDSLSYYDFTSAVASLAKMANNNAESFSNVQNIVTGEMVAEAMVAVLGYDMLTVNENLDSYSIAEKYDIFSGVKVGKTTTVNREQFAKILSTTLKSGLVIVDSSEGHLKYTLEEDITILTQMDIYRVRGWVNATRYTNMYSQNPAAKGDVMIDLLSYAEGTSDVANYLGRYVEAYIHDDDGDKTVVCAYVYESKDNYISVADTDIEKLTTSTLEYYDYDDEGNQLSSSDSIKLDSNTGVIYNGKFVGALSSVKASILNNINGYVAAADTDFDGVYDVLFIWSYQTIYVEQVAGDVVLNSFDNKTYDLSDDDKDVRIILDGVEVGTDKIAATNILSLAVSDDKSLYTVYVAYNSVSGKLMGQTTDELQLDNGKTYTKDKNFTDTLDLGVRYMLYLTYNNKVATAKVYSESFTKTGTGRNYAYLRECLYDDFEGEEAHLRLYRLSDSTWVTLQTTPSVYVYRGAVAAEQESGGTTVSREKMTGEEVYKLFNQYDDPNDNAQLIVYETNSKGNVTSITLAVDYSQGVNEGKADDDMFVYNRHFADRVRTYYGGFFGGYYHQGSCILLRVPSDRSQEKQYGTEKISDGYVLGPMDIYDASEGLVLSGVIVREAGQDATISGAGTLQFMVENVTETCVDDEIVKEITAVGGKQYYIKTDVVGEASKITSLGIHVKDVNDIKTGDLICCTQDSLGYISQFRVDVRAGDIKLDTTSPTPYFAWNSGGDVSTMYYDYGCVKKVTPSQNVVVLNTDASQAEKYDKTRVVKGTLYSYDTKRGKFEQLSGASEILPGDKMITFSRYYYMGVIAIVLK